MKRDIRIRILLPLFVFALSLAEAQAEIPRTLDQQKIDAIYNQGEALWAISGALVLLAIAVLIAGLKIAKALGKRD